MAAKKTVEQAEIRAGRIVLVDEAGRERIVMDMLGSQPRFRMIGREGSEQVYIHIREDSDEAYIALTGLHGTPVLLASAGGTETSRHRVTLHLAGDISGQGRREVIITNGSTEESPSIELNEFGHSLARIPATRLRSKKEPKKLNAAKAKTAKKPK